MGNCLRSHRRRHEPLLLSTENEHGGKLVLFTESLPLTPSTFKSLVSLCYFSPLRCAVTLGQAQPLVQEPVVWTADVPLTTGQLRGRRDTFWDTAPMYDGRREIWDALRAAVEAAEQEDYDLAQAILSGANITLPTGTHTPHNHSTSKFI